MNTQKLYFYDSYTTDFEANIVDVIPYEDKFAVILDKSYFYPESGGQPADKGTINGEEVVHVTETEDYTLHIVQNMLHKGSANCIIVWSHRFDNMQQHTGQHILSACFYKLFMGETSSFHIGKDSSTIEIDVQSFDDNKLWQIEEMANSIVWGNNSVTASIVSKEGLAALPLRKQPKVDSDIRIINIDNCDCTPCGGTHVKNTGEIGAIKIKRIEKLKSSYKFEFVCGKRALMDYSIKNNVVNWLGAQLSASEHDIEKAYIKFTDEFKDLQRQISLLRSELVAYEVDKLQQEATAKDKIKIISKCFENRDFNAVKLMAQQLVSNPSHVVLLASSQSNQLIFARSEDVDINMNLLLKEILPMISGKGGGSPKAAQGGGSGDIAAAIAEAVKRINA